MQLDEAQLVKLFEAFDKDGNGKLDKEETSALLAALLDKYIQKYEGDSAKVAKLEGMKGSLDEWTDKFIQKSEQEMVDNIPGYGEDENANDNAISYNGEFFTMCNYIYDAICKEAG